MQQNIKYIYVIILSIFISNLSISQGVHHWETIIYNNDDWQYKIGASNIPLEWINPDFDASQWSTGPGGFGYGDNDDNTILNNVFSVFIRKEFQVQDISLIQSMVLHADFDDGFVAYLNGEEIARKNLGAANERPPYNLAASAIVEPLLAQNLLPIGFRVDPSLVTNGENTLAIQIHNQASNSSDLSSNFFLSAGIIDDTALYKPTPNWFSQSVFSSNLPIVKITTDESQEIVDEPKINAHMGVIQNEEGSNSPYDAFNNYDGHIAIEIRGTSSQTYDKKGYGFETQNEDGSNNNVKLMGMPKENDWVLHGPYSDKSLLRNVLTYHLGNLTEQYAPKTQLCELFINDQYQGIYVLVEKIKQDKNRVDIEKMTGKDNFGDEVTGGYIIKVDRNDQNIPNIGWESSFPDFKFMAFVEPQASQITTPQKNYIQEYWYNFEWAMSQPDYEETYLNYIDPESFVNYFLVTEIGKHIDAYKLSFYMYKDRDSNGGKLKFGPLWDFNLAYGNFDFACSPDPQGWSYEFPDCGSWHPFWARQIVDIPNIQHLSNCRWKELRAGPF